MSYKKKIYVSYDANDLLYYNMLLAWCVNEKQEFYHHDFYISDLSLPNSSVNFEKVISEKISPTSCFIVLISDHTLSLSSQMRIEINKAIELSTPIIVANLNGKRSIDDDLCPDILKNSKAVHISFNAKIIQHAIDTWSSYCEKNINSACGAYYYKPEVYNQLGI